MRIENLKKYSGVIPGLVALAVYYQTACRSIWVGDSGEFALVLNSLGIAHPPGYPLFTLLGRVFTLGVPFARPIFAGGLFDMVAAAASVTVIYYIFRKEIGKWMAGTMSLIWAFTPLFWTETIGVEVYTLNVLIASLIFLAAESPHRWKWAMLTYLFGLALTNHPSSFAFLPALVFLVIYEKQYRFWRQFPIYAALLLLAGTLYLYLMIRASSNPLANWGNPDNLSSLVKHMSLEQYRGWVHNSIDNLTMSLHLLFDSVLNSWWWIGIIAVVTGIVTGWRVKRQRTIFALLIMISALALSSSHIALDYEPFYLLPMLAALILAGNNLIWLQRRDSLTIAQWGVRVAGILIVVMLLLQNYRGMDKSEYTLYEEYGRLILDSAERGVVFTAGDINSFAPLYLRYAEGYKPDVEIYDRSVRLAALMHKAKSLTGRNFGDFQAAREAVIRYEKGSKYLVKNHHFNEPSWQELSVPLHSFGILYAVQEKPNRPVSITEYPSDFNPGDLFSRQLLANLDLARGEELSESSDSQAAQRAFSMAIGRMKDEPRAEVVNQIGIFFRQAAQYQLALETYDMALRKPLMTSTERNEIMYNISNVYKDLGNVCLKVNDFKGAATNYTKALEHDTGNSRLLLNLGIIYAQRLNEKSKGIDYLNRYLAQNPSDTEIRRLVNSLQ